MDPAVRHSTRVHCRYHSPPSNFSCALKGFITLFEAGRSYTMPPTLSTETGYSGTVSLLPLPMSLNSTRAVSRASTWQTRVFANNEPEPKTVPPTPPPRFGTVPADISRLLVLSGSVDEDAYSTLFIFLKPYVNTYIDRSAFQKMYQYFEGRMLWLIFGAF